jgi:hypothetical protein
MGGIGADPNQVKRIEWSTVIRWALLGVVLQGLLVVGGVLHNGPLVDIVAPGRDGPAEAVIRHDFPSYQFVRTLGHDGQQYYAAAREPMHLHNAAKSIVRPRYVLQRILFPGLAWMLHPSPGPGLVVAMVVVGILGLLALALSVGGWASQLGASPRLGLVAALLPGSNAALQVSTPDTLALGLALGSLLAIHRRSPALAVALGAGAILAKESAGGIVIAGFLSAAVAHRWRLSALAILPAALWWVALRLIFPGPGTQVVEFGAPFAGIVDSFNQLWRHGYQLWGLVYVVGVLVAGPLALWRLRRPRAGGQSHALWWPLAVQLAMVCCLGINSVGPNYNASRIVQPAVVLALLALVPSIGGQAQDTDTVEASPTMVLA